MAKDFFGQEIQVGDTVAGLGTHYKELYLFKVLSISEQKVRLEPAQKMHMYEDKVTSKFHYQVIVKKV